MFYSFLFYLKALLKLAFIFLEAVTLEIPGAYSEFPFSSFL